MYTYIYIYIYMCVGCAASARQARREPRRGYVRKHHRQARSQVAQGDGGGSNPALRLQMTRA